jgi:hypothetical protein
VGEKSEGKDWEREEWVSEGRVGREVRIGRRRTGMVSDYEEIWRKEDEQHKHNEKQGQENAQSGAFFESPATSATKVDERTTSRVVTPKSFFSS